jgi:hypothetical protein
MALPHWWVPHNGKSGAASLSQKSGLLKAPRSYPVQANCLAFKGSAWALPACWDRLFDFRKKWCRFLNCVDSLLVFAGSFGIFANGRDSQRADLPPSGRLLVLPRGIRLTLPDPVVSREARNIPGPNTEFFKGGSSWNLYCNITHRKE